MLKISIQEKLLSLPLSEVEIVNQEFLAVENRSTIRLRLKKRRKTANCPICGRRTKKFHEKKIYLKKNVKHIFTTAEVEIILGLEKRHFSCCGDTFFEKYSFEKNGWYTNAFEEYVLREWRHLSVLELSRKCKVSDYKLWEIIRQVDIQDLAKRGVEFLEGLEGIHLGIDGHSFRGHDMVLMVTELKEGKVVAILEAENNKSIRDWLNSLPPSVLAKIKSFVIDMKMGMKNTIKETVGGNVIEVVDHYHVVQEANKMVDEVRQLENWLRREVKRELRHILKKIRKEEKALEKVLKNGNIESYVEIKQRKVFLRGAERLNPKDEALINTLLRRSKYLQEAWLEKELLRESMQAKDAELLAKVVDDCLKSEQYRIRQFGRTIKRWFQAILNFFEVKLTNAFTEGKNNKAKVIKRISYGFRNKNSYIRKLYFAL